MPGLGFFPLRVAMVAGLFLFAGTSGPLAQAQAQDRVGVSSAVNPEATGRPPGGTARRLVIGQEIVFNERIVTEANGQTQLLFLDELSMTVGPNSDLTIDQFVYDPKTGSGKLAMSATRGLLRYVGGKLSKQEDAVTLRTSTATLAVRGGAFIANVLADGTTDGVFIYGQGLKIAGLAGGLQLITRPGYHSVVTTQGGLPSSPAPVPPGQLANFAQQLDGRSGGSGGASTVPTDTSVANSGLSQTISGDLPGSLQQAQQNAGGGTAGTNFTGNSSNSLATTDNNSITTTTQSSGQQQADCATTNTCGPPPPPPPPPAPVTVDYSGRIKSTNGQGTARGFVDQTPNGDAAYSSGTLSFPQGQPQNGLFTASVGVLGNVSFPLKPGSANFQGTSSSIGPFTGTSFLSADNTFFYANITPTGQPAQRLFISGGLPVDPNFYKTTGPGLRPQAGSNTRIFAFSVQPDAALQSNIPFVRSQAGGNLPNASVSPLYVVAPPTTPIGDTSTASAARALQASVAINGQGPNQQSTIAVTTGTIGTQANGQPILNGQMRGSSLQSAGGAPVRLDSAVGSTVDGKGTSFYGGNAISGFVVGQSAPAAEVPLSGAATTYGFAQPTLATAVPTGVGANRTTQAIAGNFGGLMQTTAQATPYIVTGGTFISTDAPNNRIQATLDGSAQSGSLGVNTMRMEYGGLTGVAGSRQAFVDDKTFAVLESQVNPQQVNGQNLAINGDPNEVGKLYLLSSGAAPPPNSLLPAGASFCQCQYLQWGYWGGDLRFSNPADTSIPRTDRGHINTWVAGVPTQLNELGTLASQNVTGTYTGHAIGSVFNNGQNYVAAGGFNGTYNFGTQTGAFAVTNFDGRNFAGSGKAPLTGANYSFGVNSAGATGTINGTFYGPAAAETGGSFAVQTTVGPKYLASGTFAGKR